MAYNPKNNTQNQNFVRDVSTNSSEAGNLIDATD